MADEAFVTGALETVADRRRTAGSDPRARAFRRRAGDITRPAARPANIAHAIGAVLLDRARNVFRAVIGATERKPMVLADARPWFAGK